MKRLIFIALLMPLLAFGQNQKAVIEFQETSFDFGTIGENDGKAVHVFQFKNTGELPLILTNVRAGCGCTTPEWSRQPIAPGESGNIKVSFDPRNRPGAFTKSVTVNSNATNSVVSLTIRGNVSRKPVGPYEKYRYQVGPVKIFNNGINLGNIKNNQQLEKKLAIVNTGDQPAILKATSDSPAISVTVSAPSLTKGAVGHLLVKYDAAQKADWGFVSDIIRLTVNDQDKGSLNITANISEDFSFYEGNFEKAPVITLSETEANLENVAPNSINTHEFYIQNTGKSELIIRKTKASDPETSIALSKTTIKPGKKVKAVVTYKTKNAKSTQIIQLITNDPQHSTLNYKIVSNTGK
ncbi:MAG: DUF1573 domain-containing protein [Odoribacter sp.]|nr:DUF1573 domain-containing protein [Odoribacter sp.]